MRTTRPLVFFVIAFVGIALIAWEGVGRDDGGEATTIEAILIVAAVLLGAHAFRYLIYRIGGKDGGRS